MSRWLAEGRTLGASLRRFNCIVVAGPDPDATAAWILVAAESDFSRVSTEWKANTTWFNQLEQSGSDPSVVSTVRHAILAYLADSLRPK